jgi:nitronate monooxygenase
MWPDQRLCDLFAVDIPIVQAPMAGAMDTDLAVAVAQAGGLGSLPAGMLDPGRLREQVALFRERAPGKSVNLNFFNHALPLRNNAREHAWHEALRPYYAEYGLEVATATPSAIRAPFDGALCETVEDVEPEVVSFHYGLPSEDLLARVKATGCKVIASATTVAEARHLAERGCDAVIAQGLEAGGHRGMFLNLDLARQVGTFALVPQVADAVAVPVIAAGGIGDARGIVAALALGAAGVQIGTAYLCCPEAKIRDTHRAALRDARDDGTVITNVLTGRPARSVVNRAIRELGPISGIAPEFPLASAALAPLAAAAQAQGSGDFSPLWAGQAAALGRAMPARELTLALAAEAEDLMRRFRSGSAG